MNRIVSFLMVGMAFTALQVATVAAQSGQGSMGNHSGQGSMGDYSGQGSMGNHSGMQGGNSSTNDSRCAINERYSERDHYCVPK